MIGYGLSLDPLRSAPPEMRRWIEREVAASLAALAGPPHELPQPHAASLATCLPEEALHVFELIKGEFPLSQVFFELARETPANPAVAPWHAIDLADLLRHTRIPDGDRLADCLGAINRAFPAIRNDPGASLFGFDPQGHIFIQETTRRSIRQVWEQLFTARVPAAGLPERTGRSSAASRRRAWVPAKASRGIPRPRPICPVSGRGNGSCPALRFRTCRKPYSACRLMPGKSSLPRSTMPGNPMLRTPVATGRRVPFASPGQRSGNAAVGRVACGSSRMCPALQTDPGRP